MNSSPFNTSVEAARKDALQAAEQVTPVSSYEGLTDYDVQMGRTQAENEARAKTLSRAATNPNAQGALIQEQASAKEAAAKDAEKWAEAVLHMAMLIEYMRRSAIDNSKKNQENVDLGEKS